MRVLGLDCGGAVTGYGIIDSDGHQHRLIEYGAIRLAPSRSFAERLHEIHSRISELIERHRPDCVAIEDVFYSQNVRTALKLSHVRGVSMQAAAARGLTVAEYPPLAVKSAVTGYGRAEKGQVQHMVRSLLALTEIPEPLDASDALAVAICHIHNVGALAARG